MENISREEALKLLNAPERLENLRKLVAQARAGKLPLPETHEDVNNHIHTTFSFSPYSPTAAAWFSWQAGLCTCGLVDHDSVAGAEEFLEACRIVGIPGTVGIECRATMDGTPFEGMKMNNPDQLGVAYLTIHGVPHDKVRTLDDYFAPRRALRNARNRKMVAGLNGMMGAHGIELDFDRDVVPISMFEAGGTITERHLSSALATKLIERFGAGQGLVDFIKRDLQLPIAERIEGYLMDANNPFMLYDLIGWIKVELISKFYVDATDELVDFKEIMDFADEIGAIMAYPYLGDVGDSVTGDKRAQQFEDAFLDELFPYLRQTGYRAICYMPSRNTVGQLERLRALCKRYEMFEISGEDINQPRQSFVCMAQRASEFRHLYESTWALIAHENRATEDPAKGFFGAEAVKKYPGLDARVKAFAQIGRSMKP
ncbi:PHP domain-containing protein [Bacillota bacterium Meth-B3]|nr:PHP domain-containing protein [Christensenellaceae bacterium]MEA5068136.1 PHP domain-containing protein [Christensenellaceae bacterium]